MTSRGLVEADFEQIAGFLHEVLQVSRVAA
jgi:hypothetical protein